MIGFPQQRDEQNADYPLLAPGSPPQEMQTRQALVLIVEDHQEMSRFIARILAATYRIAVAHTGTTVVGRATGDAPLRGSSSIPWERFYRVQGVEVLSGSHVGLELGLYICHTIIEEHRGQVGVQSVPGNGSTFWFTLPLTQQDEQAAL